MDPLEVLQKMFFEDPDTTPEERERKKLIEQLHNHSSLAMKCAVDWANRNEHNVERLPEVLDEAFYAFRDFVQRTKAQVEAEERRITEEKSQ